MDDILAELPPSYRGEELSLAMDDLRWRWFSTGDAFCKAILCLYAYFEPKSFASNGLVKIDNSWLKQANSKNYHHFFPRRYLEKVGLQDWQANTILNITIVDDYLNKRWIRAKPPSEYMRTFAEGLLSPCCFCIACLRRMAMVRLPGSKSPGDFFRSSGKREPVYIQTIGGDEARPKRDENDLRSKGCSVKRRVPFGDRRAVG